MKNSILPLFVLMLAFITTAAAFNTKDDDKNYKKTEVTKEQLPQQVQNVLNTNYSDHEFVVAYKMVPANAKSTQKTGETKSPVTGKENTKTTEKDPKKPRAVKSDVTDTEIAEENTDQNATTERTAGKSSTNPDEEGVHYEVVLTDGKSTKNVKIKSNGQVIE